MSCAGRLTARKYVHKSGGENVVMSIKEQPHSQKITWRENSWSVILMRGTLLGSNVEIYE